MTSLLWADIIVDPPIRRAFERFGAEYGADFAAALLFFALFALILAVPLLRGRQTKRRCACAASKEVMRVLDEREKAARRAALYDPASVNTADLPQASPELAEYARK